MKPYRFVRALTGDERRAVEELVRTHPKPRVRARANAILLSAGGHSARQIAKLLGAGYQTVHGWLARFEREGAAGLVNRPKPGATPKAGPDYKRQLREAVAARPADLGYPFATCDGRPPAGPPRPTHRRSGHWRNGAPTPSGGGPGICTLRARTRIAAGPDPSPRSDCPSRQVKRPTPGRDLLPQPDTFGMDTGGAFDHCRRHSGFPSEGSGFAPLMPGRWRAGAHRVA